MAEIISEGFLQTDRITIDYFSFDMIGTSTIPLLPAWPPKLDNATDHIRTSFLNRSGPIINCTVTSDPRMVPSKPGDRTF
jgi:hypothetical protein